MTQLQIGPVLGKGSDFDKMLESRRPTNSGRNRPIRLLLGHRRCTLESTVHTAQEFNLMHSNSVCKIVLRRTWGKDRRQCEPESLRISWGQTSNLLGPGRDFGAIHISRVQRVGGPFRSPFRSLSSRVELVFLGVHLGHPSRLLEKLGAV